MRFFFTGPRVMGLRPGISFGARELKSAFRPKSSSGAMTGSFVYVIEGENGRHKIGVSRDPIQRLSDLQTGSPYPLRFAYIGVTPGIGFDIEGMAHDLLDAHRVINEWFAVPASIAIGAVLEAAQRARQPIQQVQPGHVPQIIRLANRPDPDQVQQPPWVYRRPWKFLSAIFGVAFVLVFALIRSVTG